MIETSARISQHTSKEALDAQAVTRDGYVQQQTILAEVDSVTGEVVNLAVNGPRPANPSASYDDGTPESLWFRDIVLEDTIFECEDGWECMGNG